MERKLGAKIPSLKEQPRENNFPLTTGYSYVNIGVILRDDHCRRQEDSEPPNQD